MSKENISKFKDELQKRPELQQKLKEAKDMEAFVALAKAQGFDFTAKEFTECGKDVIKSGKLSDEDLDKVSGGGIYTSAGELKTTIGYTCQYWQPSHNTWVAVRGCCGSCFFWYPPNNDASGAFYPIGVPLICGNSNNREKR